MSREAVIAAYFLTLFTFAGKGPLAQVRPENLGAHVIRSLLKRTGIEGVEIKDAVWGCAFPEGEQGLNIGRVVGLRAGLPITTAGMTVNRWCGSSGQAVQIAYGMILMGAGDAYIAGGTESISRVPMMGFNMLPPPSWTGQELSNFINVGLSVERVAREPGVSHAEQDAFALSSHRKALAAQKDGRLYAKIAPIAMNGQMVANDGCIRYTTAERLAGLKTVFLKDGTVTAGSSSPMTEGATALLICTPEFAESHGLTPPARVAGFGVSGCEPDLMGMGPVESSRKTVRRTGLKMSDIDLIEMTEAFAAQAEACRRLLASDPARLNVDGGAIALGHPLGATGGRLVGEAATLLKRTGKRYALATQCIGDGMGIAMVLEAA